jgi:hypothetical protein
MIDIKITDCGVSSPHRSEAKVNQICTPVIEIGDSVIIQISNTF